MKFNWIWFDDFVKTSKRIHFDDLNSNKIWLFIIFIDSMITVWIFQINDKFHFYIPNSFSLSNQRIFLENIFLTIQIDLLFFIITQIFFINEFEQKSSRSNLKNVLLNMNKSKILLLFQSNLFSRINFIKYIIITLFK
jgi:hypothetical protein